jgi:hypothetical protein
MKLHITRYGRSRRAKKLGGYPNWELELCLELDSYAQSLTDSQRKARLLGKELDAAIEEPRSVAGLVDP